MQDILEYNSALTDMYMLRSKLNSKYKQTVNLYGHFDRFFIIAQNQRLSEEQIKQYLINANDEIAFLYCSSLSSQNARNNELYQKYFPLMFNKLSNNIEYLYICLFKSNYWYLAYPALYYNKKNANSLIKSEHLFLLEPHLEDIFNRWGDQLYKKCKRGYNKMFVFFLLFQEYFTEEMITTFIQSMYKKLRSNSYNRGYIAEYLNSPSLRISFNNEQWEALQLLLKS